MKTGITQLSLIPVRASATDVSEQVTQLLFGEYFEIMQKQGTWLHIRSLRDNYEGWIDKRMAGEIFSETKNNKDELIIKDLICKAHDENGNTMYIPCGGIISVPDKNKSFMLGNNKYTLNGPVNDVDKNIEASAKRFLNAPYLWGGKTVFGIDCSGFVQIVFRTQGIELPRDATQQVKEGETICFRHDAVAGDVAFFEDNNGKIIHTGIILDEQHIIHASGCVRIDVLDHSGIYNADIKRYSHNLSVIKRFIKH
ncbi:MAG: NlpC/P60 family protein [Bacteroidota bacterium]